ncbi:MAG: B12-binding domain-containing radical SAM protein [Clostridia bacterium]|nr:B12-binding domain-containing radical SAM protein [Clostridia bacterium]MBR5423083.1 B12-binding domain-containing radical SAM protein [Clostridia bacterium]
MRILLVNPKTEMSNRAVSLPLGLLSIASFLSANGHTVRLLDRTVELQPILETARSFMPDIVGVSLISYKMLEDALFVSGFFKKAGLPVIWGGPTASTLPKAVLNNDCVDAVSIGEGEETWLDLANAYAAGTPDLFSIPGLALRGDGGETVFTPERPFLDLAGLPETDWSFVDVEKYFQTSYGCKRMLYLYASKGCPFSCVFCYNKEFHRCTYRKRPLEQLLNEIKYLVTNHRMDGVYFADELWCRSRSEMREICDALRGLDLDFIWGCQTRIGIFDQEDFEYMFRSGCRWMFFGVESGSKRVLQMMNKRLAYDKVESTFAACKRAGIVTIGSFIAGFPGETPEDLRETVAMIERLDTTLINLNFFIVMPGSDIYRRLVEEGLYPEITDLHRLEEEDFMLRMANNYSEVPMRDLRVVQSWYMWRSFSSGHINVGGKDASFTKKVISDAFKSLRSGTLRDFLRSTWYAVKEFSIIAYFAHAYPGIRKKYGIPGRRARRG